MKRIVILGSTGSIGTQALDVVAAHPDRFSVVGLAAGRDARTLAAQAERFAVSTVALAHPTDADGIAGREVLTGPEAATTLATLDADLVINGITGARGLAPTLAALEAGTPVALANKESLIIGGDLVIAAAQNAAAARNVPRDEMLIPVDSEHSALAQCLRSGRSTQVRRLVLTASGGPFRGRSRSQLVAVTPAQALAHPTWDMGPVITINSATLMNKGLELIEAHELFDTPWERLDVVVHPQSIVHSMVEFTDGSTIAQLSPPDMRLPIQLAMAWPERLDTAYVSMDWTRALSLDFEPADRAAFPALELAERAGRRRGTHPAVLNAANEQAVAAFLDGRLSFLGIADIVDGVLSEHERAPTGTVRDIGDVLEADAWARARADELVTKESR